jgi:hypothetical protein
MRRGGRLIQNIHRFTNKPLSTEEQEQPEQPDAKSADSSPLVRHSAPNHKPPNNQTTYSQNHKRNFFGRLKDRFYAYHVRELCKDPRAWIEIIALGTLGLYTHYAGVQSDAMNKTLAEVRKQTGFASTSAGAATAAANAAKKAIDQSRDQFTKDQRPYVWLTNNGIGKPEFAPSPNSAGTGQVVWTYHYTDYGKTPAYNIHISHAIRVGDRPFQSYGFKGKTLGAPLPPGNDVFVTVVSDPGIPKEDWDRLVSKSNIKRTVSIHVRMEYSDATGGDYETGICLRLQNNGAIAYCRDGNFIR